MAFTKRVLTGFFLGCCLLLSQCTTKLSPSLPTEASSNNDPYPLSASTYLALAKKQQGVEQQALYLKAAGRLIDEGCIEQARKILTHCTSSLKDLSDEKTILLATIDLKRHQPTAAITALAFIKDNHTLSPYQQIRFHTLLAKAYHQTHHPLEAFHQRLQLTPLLKGKEQRAHLQATWLSLAALSSPELHALALESAPHSDKRGWLELASLSRRTYRQSALLIAAVNEWKQQYPHHPATPLLQTSDVSLLRLNKPAHLAVLLPLTGPLAGPGHAIRDGILAAYAKTKDSSITLRFYDTAKTSASLLYQQAWREGADSVIGPLTKTNVALIEKLPHPGTTLVFNEVEQVSPNLFVLSLSPEEEARQLANRAHQEGHKKALVLTPKGLWGEQIARAFTQRWQANEGVVMDTLLYTSEQSLAAQIKAVLAIDESEARNQALKKALGLPVVTTLRRREDFDVIVLIAYPSKGRAILPLLHYYYAGDVPIYATSSIYAGYPESMKDRDLSGVYFCDIPWLFKHHQRKKHWPEQLNSYDRLYALGLESYDVTKQLNKLKLFPAIALSEDGSMVYLKNDNTIRRYLAWGQFKNGLAEAIG